MCNFSVVYFQNSKLALNTSTLFQVWKDFQWFFTFLVPQSFASCSCAFWLFFIYFLNFIFNIRETFKTVITIYNILKVSWFVFKLLSFCYIFFSLLLTIWYFQICVSIKFACCILNKVFKGICKCFIID